MGGGTGVARHEPAHALETSESDAERARVGAARAAALTNNITVCMARTTCVWCRCGAVHHTPICDHAAQCPM